MKALPASALPIRRATRARAGILVALFLSASLAPSPAAGLSRAEVMTRARAFAYHPWRATAANATASCSSAYRSIHGPGDYLGLPYDWGGYMTVYQFDQQIAAGAGAGSYPDDGVLACTAGLDCSGFVSQCWGVGHHTTRNLADISTPIQATEALPGDVFNEAGYHVSLYSHRLGNGQPVWYEAIFYNVHVNVSGGWSWVSGWQPLRHGGITGTAAGDPVGTPTNPIPITSFPFHDTRDTRQSSSDVLDRCGAATDKPESGPEYVYRATFTQPGQLTVSVSDDVGVDIDVHLYESMNTGDCTARHDSTFTRAVDCGTYYIVADTYGSDATRAGPYNLTVTFTPSGQPCGAGPATYEYAGEPGTPCAYPGHEDLPFCNPNLGVDTCLYTSTSSFCSHACAGDGDCPELPGGCCREIAPGESYCMPAPYCSTPDAGAPGPDAGTTVADAGVAPDAGWDPPTDAGVSADAGIVPDAGAPFDAGTVVDAGTWSPDAGTLFDAGTWPFDAGVGTPDAGPVPPTANGGCQSVPGGGGFPVLALLSLLLFAGWRRRWARSPSQKSRGR